MRPVAIRLLALAAIPLFAGCVFMPRTGTPVFVERTQGEFWSGKGMLTEVSPDQRKCRVAIRTSALIVEQNWYDCADIHPRQPSDTR